MFNKKRLDGIGKRLATVEDELRKIKEKMFLRSIAPMLNPPVHNCTHLSAEEELRRRFICAVGYEIKITVVKKTKK